MRAVFLTALLVAASAAAAQSHNMTLVGTLDPRPQGYADVWGYVGPTGREYALINARSGGGLSVIDVTDTPFVEEEYIPGSGSGSDVEVYSTYAYVSDDFGPTQIINLTNPENPSLVRSFGSGVHTLTVAGNYLYTQGGTGNGGVLIYSLANPTNPALVGQYQPHYVHDILVRGDTMYTAGIFGDGIDIVDISNRANPQLIERFNYPGSGAHNICSDASGSYIYVGDEIGSGQWTRIFDVRDPHNVEQVGAIIVDPNSTVHNCHVKDDLLYIGYYDGYGARVYDISEPAEPVEIAYYETGSGMMWSVYPHLPSGKLLGSLYSSGGLYVFRLEAPSCAIAYQGAVTGTVTGGGGTPRRVTFTGTVTNSGTGPRSVSFTLNYNRKIGGNPGPPQGSRRFGPFSYGPGATNFSLNVPVPANAPAGTYNWELVLEDKTTSPPQQCGEQSGQVTLPPARTAGADAGIADLVGEDAYMESFPVGSSTASAVTAPTTTVTVAPNPFATAATIRFALEAPTEVRLAVYDVLGREVAVLVDGPLEAGAHVAVFDGRGLPSGTYVYRLTAGRDVQTGRMALAR
jgi:choice-of-anchor B domain-containing protein